METIWERPERARPATVPLSRESIVRAAIELADADGLAAVSVRKVAAALGAGPMRLYGHLATKEELLDLMLDEVHGEIPLGPGPDWRATLEIIARGTRAAALRHPWFADLLGSRPHLGPFALARLEATLAALAAGLPDIDAVARAAETVGSYVTGAIRRETGHDDARWRAESGPYLTRMFATGRYPQLTRFVTESTHIDPEASFDAGLRLILDGLGR